jgi:hypothetical protein
MRTLGTAGPSVLISGSNTGKENGRYLSGWILCESADDSPSKIQPDSVSFKYLWKVQGNKKFTLSLPKGSLTISVLQYFRRNTEKDCNSFHLGFLGDIRGYTHLQPDMSSGSAIKNRSSTNEHPSQYMARGKSYEIVCFIWTDYSSG